MVLAFRAAAASFLAIAFMNSSAFAQEKGHRLAACKSDIDKFCAGEPRGKGKIRACLQSNKDKLAPECKAALDGASQG
jgi:hypothetical protein